MSEQKNIDFNYIFGYQMPRNKLNEGLKYAGNCRTCSVKTQANKNNSHENQVNGSNTTSSHTRANSYQ